MALKKVITAEEHTGLDASLQNLYVASADGFALDVDGGFEDVTGLKSALEKERKAARDALAKIKKFEGFDPDEYAALKTDKEKAEQERAMKAGEYDSLLKKHKDDFTKKEQALLDELAGLKKNNFDLQVTKEIIGCDLFNGKTLMTSDAAISLFSKNFKIENGVVVGYLDNGEKITDAAKSHDAADFKVAIQALWNAYPNKDKYERSTSPGSGAPGGAGGSGGAGGKLTIEQAGALNFTEYEAAKKAGRI